MLAGGTGVNMGTAGYNHVVGCNINPLQLLAQRRPVQHHQSVVVSEAMKKIKRNLKKLKKRN